MDGLFRNSFTLSVIFNEGTLAFYDYNKDEFIGVSALKNNGKSIQANCMNNISEDKFSVGCDDGLILLYDSRSGEQESKQGHQDGITSLTKVEEVYTVSTGHDNKVKLWDIRNWEKPLDELAVLA